MFLFDVGDIFFNQMYKITCKNIVLSVSEVLF
jgi:hypothetical protein